STFAVVKSSLNGVSPLIFLGVRFGMAAIFFPVIFRKNYLRMNLNTLKGGIIIGGLLWVGFALQTIGLKYTTASKSAFITGLLVALTPLTQALIEKKTPTRGNIIGIIIIVIGLYLLTSPGGQGLNAGDLLTFGCSVAFSVYIVYLDIFSKQHDVSNLTLLQLIMVSGLSFAATPFVESASIHLTIPLVISFLYLSLLATVFATYIQTKYQRETTPTRAAVIFAAEPVFANVIAFIAFREFVGFIGAVGGAFIVCGLLVSELMDR
ncbi:MAG: DMT family transporter, partial [Candidatus Kryptoniota bacterium]